MRCDWEPRGDRHWRCRRCGRQIVLMGEQEALPADRLPPCGADRPRILQQGSRYARAIAHWIAAGRPLRSDQRVREIFETLCRPCEHFDSNHGSCRLCGCRIRRDGSAFTNKLKMATERCPANPPKWLEQVHKDGPQ